jgi:hypothetical protein
MFTEDIHFKLKGATVPPPNMIEAARQSLPADKFEELMRQTGGEPPTPAQLCALVDSLNGS